jgi:Domain of unknown function (DUF2017)
VGHDAEGRLIARGWPGLDPRVRRTRRGDYELRIPEPERVVLRKLAAELRELLPTDDPALERVFPPAYADDPEANEEYRELMKDDLLRGRLDAIETLERTIDAKRLDEEQLTAWMSALNDVRLVLGTRLEVTEESYEQDIEDDSPEAYQMAIYHYLGWLEEQVVGALADTLEHPPKQRDR